MLDAELDSAWLHPCVAGLGFENQGATCYINSTVQCVVHNPFLANLALEGRLQLCNCRSCVLCYISYRIRSSFKRSMESARGYPEWMVNKGIKTLGTLSHDRLSATRQEDAHDFLRQWLDKAHDSHEVVLRKHTPKPQVVHTIVDRVFGGILASRVQCQSCGQVSSTYDAMNDLSVEVDDGLRGVVGSVQDALARFVKPEIMAAENAYHCEHCNRKQTAHKSLHIHTAPNTLTLHLKRFRPDFIKLTGHIAFPLKLNLGPYLSPDSPELDPKIGPGHVAYKLTAVLVHTGAWSSCGHYYAYVLDAENQWWILNDEVRYKVNPAEVFRRCEAYMLFYVRLRPRQQPPTVPKSQVMAPSNRKRQSPLVSGHHVAAEYGLHSETDPETWPLTKRVKVDQQQQPQPQQQDDLKQHAAALLGGSLGRSSSFNGSALGSGLAVQQAQKQTPLAPPHDPSLSNGVPCHADSLHAASAYSNGVAHTTGTGNGGAAAQDADSSGPSDVPFPSNGHGHHSHTRPETLSNGRSLMGWSKLDPDLDESPQQPSRAGASPHALPGWVTGDNGHADTSQPGETNGTSRRKGFGFPSFSFKGRGPADTVPMAASEGSTPESTPFGGTPPQGKTPQGSPPASSFRSKLGRASSRTAPSKSTSLGKSMEEEEPRLVRRKLNSSPAFDSDGQLASLPTASHHRLDSMQEVRPDAETADAVGLFSKADQSSEEGASPARQNNPQLGDAHDVSHYSEETPAKQAQHGLLDGFRIPGPPSQPKRLASIYQPSAAPPDDPHKPPASAHQAAPSQLDPARQERVSFRLPAATKNQPTAGQVSRQDFPTSFGSKSTKSAGRAWHTSAQPDLPLSNTTRQVASNASATQLASNVYAQPGKQFVHGTVPGNSQAAVGDQTQQASDALTAGKQQPGSGLARRPLSGTAVKKRKGIFNQMGGALMGLMTKSAAKSVKSESGSLKSIGQIYASDDEAD